MEPKKKIFNRNWIFPYVFLFSFLWRFLLVGILQIHPLQDQFYVESPFDELFISTIAFASFILALVCVVLRFPIRVLSKNTKGKGISSELWIIGFILLHGGILPLLPACFIWQAWPFDAYMTSQFYLAWIPAAIAGPVLWWFLLKRLDRERTVASRNDVIDDELVNKNRRI
jgi:hypothetical protein